MPSPAVIGVADIEKPYEEEGGQINVPPKWKGALWKVICSAIRCPRCGSSQSKAMTGKRTNSQGLSEHYRSCDDCGLRFRVVFE